MSSKINRNDLQKRRLGQAWSTVRTLGFLASAINKPKNALSPTKSYSPFLPLFPISPRLVLDLPRCSQLSRERTRLSQSFPVRFVTFGVVPPLCTLSILRTVDATEAEQGREVRVSSPCAEQRSLRIGGEDLLEIVSCSFDGA
jgi:hypothetical protein